MKKLSILVGISILLISTACQAQDAPRLIIRGDDIGSTHGANLGCIQAYKDGIMRSTDDKLGIELISYADLVK